MCYFNPIFLNVHKVLNTMKKFLFIIVISALMLTGCNAVLNYNMRNSKTGDYKEPSVEQPKAKVIMVGGEGVNAYYFMDYIFDKESDLKPEQYEFPSKKREFNIPLPENFQGEILHSFYMSTTEHQLGFRGYLQTAFSTKRCVMDVAFTPKANKNYLFYFYKDDDKCRIKLKEAIEDNGHYKFIDAENLLKDGVRNKSGFPLSYYVR